MATSIFLAKLLGPILVVLALSWFIYLKEWKKMIKDFVKNEDAIRFSGIIALLFSWLLVMFHNVWVWDWTLIITIFAWLGVLKGLFRLLLPPASKAVIKSFTKTWVLIVAGVIIAILGLVLSYFGFWA
ncbi:hypothetical protein HQ571_03385 [Candidatus Kuenenbacteria bacterium]|nr:hypothetical protein [Candidatus Kuenenbacteria bacterium]